MKRLTAFALAALIAGTLSTGAYVVVESLLDYSPLVEATPVPMGTYRGYNVKCSTTPLMVRIPGNNLLSTCAKANFVSLQRDPDNRDRCRQIIFYGRAARYTWGMTFTVERTTRSTFTCLRPA